MDSEGMTPLEKVFSNIEAFVKDMEDLGVEVKVEVGDPVKRERQLQKIRDKAILKPGTRLLAVIKMELKEDLEASP